MDRAHDNLAHGARRLLAGLTAGASSPQCSEGIDVRERLDLLVAERASLTDVGFVPVLGGSRHWEQRQRLFSLVGSLLGFSYAWGDLFPILLGIRTLDEEPADPAPAPSGELPVSDELTAGHAFLLQIARSHLAALADGVHPVAELDYDAALEDLDALYPPFAPPPTLPVPKVPRRVNHDVVIECLRQIAWYAADAVGLLHVRALLDATWEAETRDIAVVGGAS